MSSAAIRLAIDLGGTSLRLGVGGGRGPWLKREDRPRPDDPDGAELVATVRRAIAEWDGPGPVSAIGVSVAAVVRDDGHIERAENLGWTDLPLGRRLRDATGLPVTVDTDVFCGALAEARICAARGAASALYLAVGTGIGHAFILDGQVHRGLGRAANAFGHLVRDPDGPPCYCGGRGCVCLISAGAAQASGTLSDDSLRTLAWSIGQAITLMAPECVVLTGGALRQPWFDLGALTTLVPQLHYPGVPAPVICLTALDDPNLRGAALMTELEMP